MSKYLNRARRELLGITLAQMISLEEVELPRYKKKTRRHLRSAITQYNNFLESLFSELGPEEGQKIVRDFKGAVVGYHTPNKVTGPEVKTITLDIDSLGYLAEGILEGFCATCDGHKEDCRIREILLEADIPSAEGIDCPYKG